MRAKSSHNPAKQTRIRFEGIHNQIPTWRPRTDQGKTLSKNNLDRLLKLV